MGFFRTITEQIHISSLTNRQADDISVFGHVREMIEKITSFHRHVDAVVPCYNSINMTVIFALCFNTMNSIYRMSPLRIVELAIGI